MGVTCCSPAIANTDMSTMVAKETDIALVRRPRRSSLRHGKPPVIMLTSLRPVTTSATLQLRRCCHRRDAELLQPEISPVSRFKRQRMSFVQVNIDSAADNLRLNKVTSSGLLTAGRHRPVHRPVTLVVLGMSTICGTSYLHGLPRQTVWIRAKS